MTRIVGYAGTGKTTVMAAVARELAADCVILAPTNKAAMVLREKGIEKAQTIHSLLYAPYEGEKLKKDKDGNIIYEIDKKGEFLRDVDTHEKVPVVIGKELVFGLKECVDLPKYAAVDEASMLDEEIMHDLEDAFESVILFGDGFQLPPIKGIEILNAGVPDIFLNEVHRVAFDNPIIRYATDIRNGNEPDIMDVACHEIKTCSVNNTKLYKSIVENDVQAISWRNETRHNVNEAIRRQKGYERYTLVDGEPIVACQSVHRLEGNHYDGRTKVLVMYNGQIVNVKNDYEANDDHFTSQIVRIDKLGAFAIWPFWNPNFFQLKDNNREWWQELNRRKAGHKKPIYGSNFDYAYCLTAHKAQGSEFKNVAIFDERNTITHANRENKQRWYYTAITRAKERILVVR